MSHVLFIRHGETAMAGRFCGHSDPGLNERGRNQLIPLLEQLSEEPIGFIYSSDLQRAVSTAEAIATGRNLPLVTRPGLREINFGQWEGLSWAEIERSNAEYAREWMAAYPHLPAPEGETVEAFEMRVLKEVNNILGHHDGPIAVVTHAGVLRVVLRHLCGCSEQTAWQRTQSYCCIVRYEMKGVHP
jgi:alpha-ribazole phosphatase